MIIKGNKRFFLIISSVFILIFLLIRCGQSDKKGNNEPARYSQFAGSASCMQCHKDIYEKHLMTEHFLSSAPAKVGNIKGSFEKGKNEYHFTAVSSVLMERKGDSLLQTEYVMGNEKQKRKIDIVVGSGRKGQSFLSWKHNSLIQLPVTYFTPDSAWSTSPGFNPGRIVFNRVVTSRCLECHSTYFEKTSPEEKHPEEFDRTHIIYGIDCEKCHGPGKEHVSFHTQNPNEKKAKHIINPAEFSRQQRLDLCALCHSGKLDKTKPSFSFRAGDKLSEYFSSSTIIPQSPGMDVHGNQLGLLSSSKCFITSDMTCISCHNVHENEKGRLEVFSERCMSCHNGNQYNQCKLTGSIGSIISKNCIDCHMPLQPSQSIAVYLEGETVPTPAKLRTHYVTIYKEESDKVLQFLKLKQ